MSEQQADILTSELEYYRTLLNPIITKVIRTVLRLEVTPTVLRLNGTTLICRMRFSFQTQDLTMQGQNRLNLKQVR